MKALVLHGFTGSLDTVSLLTAQLEARGIETAMPVLRGHGTSPEHLFRTHWRDWVSDGREALLKLDPKEKEPIIIAGLSMGALVSCVLAAEFPHRTQRIALIAPAFEFRSRLIHLLPLLKRIYRFWAGNPEYADMDRIYNDTNYARFPIEAFEQTLALGQVAKDLLPQIQCPVGTFYARRDPVIPPRVLKTIDKNLGSGPSSRHLYKNSMHEMLRDVDCETVCQDVVEFLCTP